MKKLTKRKKIAKKYIAPKLIKRLKIFFVIIAIILGIAIHRIFQGDISIFLACIGLLLGTIIGLIIGRMFKILWQPEIEKVISKIDKYGVILIIIYIGIEVTRRWFFGHWLQGAALNAFGLIFFAGLFIGRLLAMLKGIKTVLIKEHKI